MEKEKKENKQEIQQRYIELQIISQHLKQLQMQINQIDEQMMELAMMDQSLDELRKSEIDSEILVPISAGIYTRAVLKERDKFIVNVGANVAVEKNFDETKEIIIRQIEELGAYREEMASKMQELSDNAQQIEEELNKLVNK